MPSEWVLSVGQLNEYVRRQLAGDPVLNALRVRGEITGFKRHFSGHLYFSIKDAQARVQCVMFRQSATTLDFEPKDGMQVILSGSASVFVRDGTYQVYAEKMTREGIGDLYVRFEQLKARLMAEGLFDPSLKKPLPLLPKRVGIVTSSSGAAFHDMVRVIRRRNPDMGILLSPAQVQGADAAADIARAIERINQNGTCDVMLVGRGGGSMEDLWAFNEEVVARAIAASRIPIISCVGHEVDFTIADFVADVRAATPSVAAELAVPVKDEMILAIRAMQNRAIRAELSHLVAARAQMDRIAASPVFTMARGMFIEKKRDPLWRLADRGFRALEQTMMKKTSALELTRQALTALNPAAVLDRGYAVVIRDGAVISNAKQLSGGDRLSIRMSGGSVPAIVLQDGENA